MRRRVVGVMGPGESATEKDLSNAFQLGRLPAREGFVVLTGGRRAGVMEAASRGAKQEGGLTIGVLPTSDEDAISEAVDIAILTDMGNARNNINVLWSHVVVACGMGVGTASEIALALKAGKQVVLLTGHEVRSGAHRLRHRRHVSLPAAEGQQTRGIVRFGPPAPSIAPLGRRAAGLKKAVDR